MLELGTVLFGSITMTVTIPTMIENAWNALCKEMCWGLIGTSARYRQVNAVS